jgi:hypothetical protein
MTIKRFTVWLAITAATAMLAVVSLLGAFGSGSAF